MATDNTFTFGIRFKSDGTGKRVGKNQVDRLKAEIKGFIATATSVEPQSLQDEYIGFLNAWLKSKVQPATLVSVEMMNLLIEDLEKAGAWPMNPHMNRYLYWAKKLRKHRDKGLAKRKL